MTTLNRIVDNRVMQNQKPMKVDMKAILAKVGGNEIAKTLQGPLQEHLRPGLRWHRGFVDTFGGSAPEVVRAFLAGIFSFDAARKWDEKAERPSEDRYAWVRAIRATGATPEELYEGGEWGGLDDTLKVQTRWSKAKTRICFSLEVDHSDGAQVVLEGPGGPLVEVRGREVVHINWCMTMDARNRRMHSTVVGGLIQSDPPATGLASAPCFNYDITHLSDCVGILAARMQQGMSKQESLMEAFKAGLRPHRPIYLVDEDMLKLGEISASDLADIDWLLAPYGLVMPASASLRKAMVESVPDMGRHAPTKNAKKNRRVEHPMGLGGVVHRILAARDFFSDPTDLRVLSAQKDKGLDFRRIALEGRFALSESQLEELAEILLHRTFRDMKQIKGAEIPSPAVLPSVEETFDLKTRPGGWNLSTVHPLIGLSKDASTDLTLIEPASVEEPPIQVAEEIDPVVQAVQGLVGRLKAAESSAAAFQAILSAKEEELKNLLASLKVAQAREEELTVASEETRRAKQQELELLQMRTGELEEVVAQLQAEVDSLRTRPPEPAEPEVASFLISPEEGDSRIPAETVPHVLADEEDRSAELVPAYFAKFHVPIPITEVLSLYEHWLLGMGPYGRARKNRVAQNGIDPEWGLGDLKKDAVDLQSEAGATINIRRNEDHVLVRYRHPDQKDLGNTWTNLAHLKVTGEGVSVEHGVVRASEEGAKRPGYTPVPAVVRDLLKHSKPSHGWEAFVESAKPYTDDNVKDLVRDLLSPDRDVPVVVVSARRGEVLVDADQMAKDWVGLATVHVDETRTPRALSEALAEAGATVEGLGCWDGAVRLYYPGFSPLSDFYEHPLFTKTQLERWTKGDVLRRIGRHIALRSIPERAPKGFFSLIEQFDVQVAHARVAALHGTEGTEWRDALEGQVRALEAALDQREQEMDSLTRMAAEAQKSHELLAIFQNDYDERGAQITRLRSQLLEADGRIQSIEAALTEAGTSAREGMVPAGCLFDLLAGKRNEIGTGVKMIQELYPDRVVFLPSAVKGAENSQHQHPYQAVKILWDLATDYWEGLQTGGEDPGPRVFGVKGYAAKESEQLTSDGRRARTFMVHGKRVLMQQHLKLGRGHSWVSDREILRVHFIWIPEDNRIYVGHIGCHLPL